VTRLASVEIGAERLEGERLAALMLQVCPIANCQKHTQSLRAVIARGRIDVAAGDSDGNLGR